VCGGAFQGLEKIVERRIGRNVLGFAREEQYTRSEEREEFLGVVEPQDLMQFGLIPELIGRLPVVTYMHELSREHMVRILTEPRNALSKQYMKLMEMEDVELEFEQAAIEAIADLAIVRKTGARGLRSILESVMRRTMFDTPSQDDVRKVIITRDVVQDGAEPKLVLGDPPADVKEA